MIDMSEFVRLFIKVFEESKFLRALARFIAIFGAIWAAAIFVERIRDSFTPLVLHLIVSMAALVICAYTLIFIYNKIYGKLSSENRFFRHPFLNYNKALMRAIRLSALDDSYFIAVTWLKFSRVVISVPIVGALLLIFEMDNHSHRLLVYLLNKEISIHSIIDAIMIAAMVSLTLFSLWQIAEINLIARGTASLVNKRRNAMARAKWARPREDV